MIKDEESVVRFVEFTPNLTWTEGLQALLQYLQKEIYLLYNLC